MTTTQLWLQSSMFTIEPDEDQQTNPGCYGRQLAHWLAGQLQQSWPAAEVIAEDWGWCIVVQRQPFLLWVGCSNVLDINEAGGSGTPSKQDQIVWSCFVEAEIPLLRKLWRKPDTQPAVKSLFGQIRQIIAAEPLHRLCESP
ncbi:hypothetical protein [Chitinilyticum aquatile]|uniref:hypothetical protein n=1 Tax=Chitinilyticum aquatile TaxID=362520 RepID=UPI00041425C1|nr:hypothetical protein [Chitinilyticum aquatile]